MTGQHTSRRRVLAGTAASLAWLSGCSADVNFSGDGANVDVNVDDGSDSGGGGTATATATATPDQGTEPADETTTAAPTGGTLELINATLSSLDPIQATDTSSMRVVQQLFDGLTHLGRADPSAVEAGLATSWSVSSDGRQYRFDLQGGATFHDGSPVRARDVVYSWERLAASENSNRASYLLDLGGVSHQRSNGEYVPGTLGVSAPDDRTLVVRLAEPNPALPALLADPAFSVIPEGYVDDLSAYSGQVSQATFAENPVGAGPFVFGSWRQSDAVSVTRFADYYGTGPRLDGVRWRIIEDSTAAAQYVATGTPDIFGVPDSQFDPSRLRTSGRNGRGLTTGEYDLPSGETVNYAAAPGLTTFYLGANARNVPYAVRRAIAYVLNQDDLARTVYDGRAEPAYHLTPPALFPDGVAAAERHADGSYPWGHATSNVAMARQVMEDAGYGPNNPYDLTVTTFQSSAWTDIVGLVRDRLAAAHVDVTHEEVPFSTLLSRGRQGNLAAYSLGWGADYPNPLNFLENAVPSATDTSTNDPEGFYLDLGAAAGSGAVDRAWQTIQSNRGPGDAAARRRAGGIVDMEEALWDTATLVPTTHSTVESFWRDRAGFAPTGAAGEAFRQYADVSKDA